MDNDSLENEYQNYFPNQTAYQGIQSIQIFDSCPKEIINMFSEFLLKINYFVERKQITLH